MTARAGDEVDSWCTKCKLDLNHRVVAMAADTIKKVVCLTCGSQHRYRAPGSGGVATKPKAAGTRRATGTAARSEWGERVKGQPSSSFTAYDIATTYSEGELVRHKKFGAGYVVSVADAQKISVMFEDGPRLLAHGRQ